MIFENLKYFWNTFWVFLGYEISMILLEVTFLFQFLEVNVQLNSHYKTIGTSFETTKTDFKAVGTSIKTIEAILKPSELILKP